MKNLYEVETKMRVGRSTSTHYNVSPTFHASASTVEVAARSIEAKAQRWARNEYSHMFGSGSSETPVTVEIVAVKLIDRDWE